MQREKNSKPRQSVENYKSTCQIQHLLLYHSRQLVDDRRVVGTTLRQQKTQPYRRHCLNKSATSQDTPGESPPPLTDISLLTVWPVIASGPTGPAALCGSTRDFPSPAPSTDIERTRLLALVRAKRKPLPLSGLSISTPGARSFASPYRTSGSRMGSLAMAFPMDILIFVLSYLPTDFLEA